jgi:hypothetical protein
MPTTWPTSPGWSESAPSANTARRVRPVGGPRCPPRHANGPSSPLRPSGRLRRGTPYCFCVRLARPCSHSGLGQLASMGRSCSAIERISKPPYGAPPRAIGAVMRDPRPGAVWSLGRLRRRAAYCEYMESPEWFELREDWVARWKKTHGAEPCCEICGARWNTMHGDLHHRSYTHLGHEEDIDLVPLCRSCHGKVHRMLESDRSWRRLGCAQATDLIIKTLRRKTLGRARWRTVSYRGDP